MLVGRNEAGRLSNFEQSLFTQNRERRQMSHHFSSMSPGVLSQQALQVRSDGSVILLDAFDQTLGSVDFARFNTARDQAADAASGWRRPVVVQRERPHPRRVRTRGIMGEVE